ncbi:Plasmodium exported protein (PHISTb), unknown, putative [Plasmodium gaboni]|uniref:Plasmodium RESA N-terminal domain-containing protein n=1 Tax=Plasmodium gaboni TaxID=647221 RepID=A0ABY1UKQ9_9APIC|nr:Plasmodium exported protein (PHISTb), unknown, putative [Plasmodium gaboni]
MIYCNTCNSIFNIKLLSSNNLKYEDCYRDIYNCDKLKDKNDSKNILNWLLYKYFCANIIAIILIISIICSINDYEKSVLLLRDTYGRNLSEGTFSSSEESAYVKRASFCCFYLYYLMFSRRSPETNSVNSIYEGNNEEVVILDELRHVSDISRKKEIEKIFKKSYEMNECNVFTMCDEFFRDLCDDEMCKNYCLYPYDNKNTDKYMNREDLEIRKELDAFIKHGCSDTKLMYTIWCRVMKNEEDKYYLVKEELQNFYENLPKSKFVPLDISNRLFYSCNDIIFINGINNEPYIVDIFEIWFKNNETNIREYKILLDATKLSWRKLKEDVLNSCKEIMMNGVNNFMNTYVKLNETLRSEECIDCENNDVKVENSEEEEKKEDDKVVKMDNENVTETGNEKEVEEHNNKIKNERRRRIGKKYKDKVKNVDNKKLSSQKKEERLTVNEDTKKQKQNDLNSTKFSDYCKKMNMDDSINILCYYNPSINNYKKCLIEAPYIDEYKIDDVYEEKYK